MCGRVIVDTATGSDTGSALQKGQLASMSHARAPPHTLPPPGAPSAWPRRAFSPGAKGEKFDFAQTDQLK